MGKPFTVNINRYDPYKTYRFLVYFGGSTSPVAAVSKVGGATSSGIAKMGKTYCRNTFSGIPAISLCRNRPKTLVNAAIPRITFGACQN